MAHSLKVGDILASRWGCGMDLCDFWKVIKVTPASVRVAPMQREEYDRDTPVWGDFKAVPVAGSEDASKAITRRVKHFWNREFVDINEYKTARLWDGEPVQCNNCD